jgi:hypothetical protein
MADKFGLIELILVFGAVLALAVIELVRTRRATEPCKREPSKLRED